MSPGAPLRHPADVDDVVAARWWTPDDDEGGRVGLEAESFPVRTAPDGAPAGRVRIADLVPLLDRVLAGRAARALGSTCWRDADGGNVTLEPGGQVEHATPPLGSPAAAIADLRRRTAALAAALAPHDIALASAGLDVWHPLAAVPQQLDAPRYRAMDAYFTARHGALGPGAEMMRRSASLQVNLDLGPPDVAGDRWLVALMAAPVVAATFAAAPTPVTAAGRASVWQALDHTRTGFPPGLDGGLRRRGDGPTDPVTATAALLRGADVMLLQTPDGGMRAGRPGWTFEDWRRDGHPELGRPTAGDLALHATTVWPEVRLRGFLEVRGVDALPARWRPVPVVLLAGLLLDDRARARARAVLEPHRGALPALARRAIARGVAEPALCALAVEVWSFALDGARRRVAASGPGAGTMDIEAAERFLDRFTLRGRCPADELREQLAVSPAAALAWATEPTEVPALIC